MKLNKEQFVNLFLLKVEMNATKLTTFFRRKVNIYSFWINANNYCLFCNNYSRLNLPHGTLLTISKRYLKKGVPTKGFRVNSVCPICGSYDRERFLNYVLDNYSDIYKKNYTILHIAPEKNIREKFDVSKNPNYVTGDIQVGKANQIVDLTNMKSQFKDNHFDFIICSHVLQDIMNEIAAINEMKRVLKKDGILILSIPVCDQLSSTLENYNIVSPIEKLINFGNRNHVRMYGNDYLNRLAESGLFIKVFQANKILCPQEIKRNRLIGGDKVMFCKKTE